MHSDLIGKIEKARRYAEDPSRISFGELRANFRGGNSDHEIILKDGHWNCNCAFFHNWGTCAHVMAMQKVLSPISSDNTRSIALARRLGCRVRRNLHPRPSRYRDTPYVYAVLDRGEWAAASSRTSKAL